MILSGCGAPMPDGLGVRDGVTLAPCPGTPNCVHTGMRDPSGTEPIYLRTDVATAELMSELRRAVEAKPRTVVISETENYLHAEATSLIFRFIDDLELLVTDDRELVVRSASRIGRGDLGVNGRRVRSLRSALGEAGLLRE